ncbi:hypothetical protein F4780DRAFT_782499 [Xylariomycetidae sp. FL0641]|nr:hypothetical protein F4780DRAFT_782499 [Xylariomycetidae sp. FL0641]
MTMDQERYLHDSCGAPHSAPEPNAGTPVKRSRHTAVFISLALLGMTVLLTSHYGSLYGARLGFDILWSSISLHLLVICGLEGLGIMHVYSSDQYPVPEGEVSSGVAFSLNGGLLWTVAVANELAFHCNSWMIGFWFYVALSAMLGCAWFDIETHALRRWLARLRTPTNTTTDPLNRSARESSVGEVDMQTIVSSALRYLATGVMALGWIWLAGLGLMTVMTLSLVCRF